MNHNDVISSQAMAGRVLRYHTWPTIHQQTVAEHSHRVAMIYIKLYGVPRAEVLVYILLHDLGELAAGDVPFYSKRRVPELKEAVNHAEELGLKDLGLELPTLTDEEWKQFKTADLLEMYEFGKIENQMGNTYGLIVCRNIEVALIKMNVSFDALKLWPGYKVT